MVSHWYDYRSKYPQNSVVGELRLLDEIYSPQLDNTRHLLVWLPPSYRDTQNDYPVIYMHDGDNLFDESKAYSGEWQVDETLTQLVSEGIEAIVVGIPNMGDERFSEYSPYLHSERGAGKADDYLRFVIETVKPRIDNDFRTLSTASKTAIMGSSMGGLISLYGFLKYPNIFGLCGAMSPVFWYGHNAISAYINVQPMNRGRIYIDVGGQEGQVYSALADASHLSIDEANDAYVAGVADLYQQLTRKGYGNRAFYVEDSDAGHNEAAWVKRLPTALKFLLNNIQHDL